MSRGKVSGKRALGRGEMQGEGELLVGFGCEGADLKELRVSFNCGTRSEKKKRKS